VSELGLSEEDADALRARPAGFAPYVPDYAGWWSRVGAYLIDAIILLASLVVVVLIGAAISSAVTALLIVVWFLASLLGYWTYFEGGDSGQTPGKRMCGIRVRNASGGRASYGQAFGRNIVARVIGLLPLVGLVDVLWPLWDSHKQCLHDKAASTIVVRV
jgi:uncharacterized RDD family membrane protein YckC